MTYMGGGHELPCASQNWLQPVPAEIKMMEKTSAYQRSTRHPCSDIFKTDRDKCEGLKTHLVRMGHSKPKGSRDTREGLRLWANRSRAGTPLRDCGLQVIHKGTIDTD